MRNSVHRDAVHGGSYGNNSNNNNNSNRSEAESMVVKCWVPRMWMGVLSMGGGLLGWALPMRLHRLELPLGARGSFFFGAVLVCVVSACLAYSRPVSFCCRSGAFVVRLLLYGRFVLLAAWRY